MPYTVCAQQEFDSAIKNPQAKASLTSSLFTPTTVSTTGTEDINVMPAIKGISIMPNAGSKDIKVLYNSSESGSAVIIVSDENGKKLLTQTANITVGKNNIVINNFYTLKEGSYSIKLIGKDNTYSSSFIVWK